MHMHRPVATARAVAAPALLFLFPLPRQAPAQQMDHAMDPETGHQMQHRMFRLPLGDWHVAGTGRSFPWSPHLNPPPTAAASRSSRAASAHSGEASAQHPGSLRKRDILIELGSGVTGVDERCV